MLLCTSTQLTLQAMTVIYSKFIHNFFMCSACIDVCVFMTLQTKAGASNLLTKHVYKLYCVSLFSVSYVQQRTVWN
jgi:hypothetical protein